MIARTSAIIALSLVQAWLLSQAFASGENYHSEEFALENAWGEFDGTQQAPTDLSLARLVQIGEGGGKFGLKNKLMKALKSAAAVKKAFGKIKGKGKRKIVPYGGDTVKPPGYTWRDARVSAKGAYHLGSGRRRIGAGYPRRRRSSKKYGSLPKKYRKSNSKRKMLQGLTKGKKVASKTKNVRRRRSPAKKWLTALTKTKEALKKKARVTHNKKTAEKLSKKYKAKAAEARKKFKKRQAAAKAKAAAAAKKRENAKKARAKKIAALKKKVAAAKARQEKYNKKKAAAKKKQQEQTKKHHAEKASKQRAKKKAAEKKAKAAKEQKVKRAKALAKARARAKKERAHKNRKVRKCTNHDWWANCTAHPISWYTNCRHRRVTWKRCGFMNAGGQYLCRRTTCRMVKVRV